MSASLKALTVLAPHLQHLSIKWPPLAFSTDPYHSGLANFPILDEFDGPLDGGRHLKEAATVAALGDAVSQLKHLRTLTVTALPDIWEARGTSEVAAAFAAQAAAELVNQGQLSSVASAAFNTLDVFGGWLLQHQLGLHQVTMGTTRQKEGFSMTWQRQQHVHDGSSSTGSTSTTAAAATSLALDCTVSADLTVKPWSVYHQTRDENDSTGSDSSNTEQQEQ